VEDPAEDVDEVDPQEVGAQAPQAVVQEVSQEVVHLVDPQVDLLLLLLPLLPLPLLPLPLLHPLKLPQLKLVTSKSVPKVVVVVDVAELDEVAPNVAVQVVLVVVDPVDAKVDLPLLLLPQHQHLPLPPKLLPLSVARPLTLRNVISSTRTSRHATSSMTNLRNATSPTTSSKPETSTLSLTSLTDLFTYGLRVRLLRVYF
jgi:hypothetical protein